MRRKCLSRNCGSEMAALHKSPIVQLLWKDTWRRITWLCQPKIGHDQPMLSSRMLMVSFVSIFSAKTLTYVRSQYDIWSFHSTSMTTKSKKNHPKTHPNGFKLLQVASIRMFFHWKTPGSPEERANSARVTASGAKPQEQILTKSPKASRSLVLKQSLVPWNLRVLFVLFCFVLVPQLNRFLWPFEGDVFLSFRGSSGSSAQELRWSTTSRTGLGGYRCTVGGPVFGGRNQRPKGRSPVEGEPWPRKNRRKNRSMPKKRMRKTRYNPFFFYHYPCERGLYIAGMLDWRKCYCWLISTCVGQMRGTEAISELQWLDAAARFRRKHLSFFKTLFLNFEPLFFFRCIYTARGLANSSRTWTPWPATWPSNIATTMTPRPGDVGYTAWRWKETILKKVRSNKSNKSNKKHESIS